MEVMPAHCSIFLPWSLVVHPAESGSSGTVLVCCGCPDRSWAQFRSQHSIEAAPQSQSAEGCIALEGGNGCRLAGVPPCHGAVLSTSQLLVVT